MSYTAGVTLFYHSHVINGVTIVHSHPFDKNIEHTHTAVELVVIQLLNHITSTTPVVVAIALLFIPTFLIHIGGTYLYKRYRTSFYGSYSHRGPPAVLFS